MPKGNLTDLLTDCANRGVEIGDDLSDALGRHVSGSSAHHLVAQARSVQRRVRALEAQLERLIVAGEDAIADPVARGA